MICCASWSVSIPAQTSLWSAFSTASFALAPTRCGGNGPRDDSGVPGVPHISGHRFFGSRGLQAITCLQVVETMRQTEILGIDVLVALLSLGDERATDL